MWTMIACAPLDIDSVIPREEGMLSNDSIPHKIDSVVVPDNHPAIVCMLKRAHQIADIEWTPLHPIPSLTNEWLPGGVKLYGIPYSSVKEKDKFVGQEVSFYTFMTAVNNPRSILYSDDVKQVPYHGVNCGTYYGTVCSMAVNYALGIERPIESKMYAGLPYFSKVEEQDANGVCLGDVLWSKGHVVLLVGIQRDVIGMPKSFTILESNKQGTKIRKYSTDSFIARWERDGWVAYRYLKLKENTEYSPQPYIHLDGDPDVSPRYNEALCTSRGDQVCYREGEEVVINLFSSSYQSMSIIRNDSFYQSLTIDTEDITLSDLPNGHYEVFLDKGYVTSEEISFEIIDTSVSVMNGKDVYFSSKNAFPEYYVVCNRTGNREVIRDSTVQERMNGFFQLDADYSGYYLKVFFKGDYGRISNEPIKL